MRGAILYKPGLNYVKGKVVMDSFQNDECTDYDLNQSTFLRTMDLLACKEIPATDFMNSSNSPYSFPS